jgi:hypothetical protein
MSMYKPVPRVPDFPAMEREILRFWEEKGIFQKLREKNAEGPRWSFLDGPITANNPMGVHHAWGRSLKDMYQRYNAMCRCALRYQNGFDCQGLWVEVEVEKSLGLKTKREIREFGIEKFVRACKERVLTYAARQTEQSIRLGYWCDWDDPKVLIALRDALADGDRVITAKLPSGHTETARASEIVRKLGSAEYGGNLPRARRDAVVRALRDGTFADGSGGRPAHYDAHFRVCAFSDQGAGANGSFDLDDDSMDADFERGRGGESGDDLSQGEARRLVLFRGERKFRARSRARPASRREARDA